MGNLTLNSDAAPNYNYMCDLPLRKHAYSNTLKILTAQYINL